MGSRDATLPIGGSTARVAPLYPHHSAAPRFHREYIVVSLSLPLSSDECIPPSSRRCPRNIRCHAFSSRSVRPSRSVSHLRNPYLSHSGASSVSLPRLSFSSLVSFSISFDRFYVSRMRLLPFFSLSPATYTYIYALLLLSLPFRLSRSRLWAAKFGRIRATTCLRHLVQCVGVCRRGA